MPKYNLANPHITGTFNSVVEAGSPQKAAVKIWNRLSQGFKSIPRYGITLEGGGEYYHFLVKESKEDGEVNFTIEQWKVKQEQEDGFKKSIEEHKEKIKTGGKNIQSGGGDEELKKLYEDLKKKSSVHPYYYWWYYPFVYPTPTLYYPNVYDVCFMEIVSWPYFGVPYPTLTFT